MMPINESGLEQVLEAFRRRMRDRGVTARDVAVATHHATSTVTRLLNGETDQPRWDTLENIACYLGLNITDVMETAYGHLPKDEQAERELVAIYRKLSDAGQEYLLRTARAFAQETAGRER